MSTKTLMRLSALFMAILGIAASFLPHEILTWFGARPEKISVLAIQVAGALYLGFAILNWTARANLIGGIYSRPVALGNFLHFVMVAIVLIKSLLAGRASVEIVVGAVVYSFFALWFGIVLFTHPVKNS